MHETLYVYTLSYLHKYYSFVFEVPARIDRLQSSNDIMAREGSNVSLICNATGFPEPTLSWSVHKADAQASQSEGECIHDTLNDINVSPATIMSLHLSVMTNS